MISRVFILLFSLACTANAFTSSSFTGSRTFAAPRSASTLSMSVVEIGSEASFDETIGNNKDALVVVDYSTTWCGPCKVIAPKFAEFSNKYPEAVFLKVRQFIFTWHYQLNVLFRYAWKDKHARNSGMSSLCGNMLIFCNWIESVSLNIMVCSAQQPSRTRCQALAL